ncbi:glycoside hydrolase family 16 protein [Bipolaris maydis ATCC 48331]|uniref:chitinase n=1 Tax=Cochliobolus heterostrophus (strain C4 / ATCC 48331 / race T) TaxID=665024 RepID=N4WHQ2_COCH4|nr:glycoside hydrolase family 16 protein [Bipolaris maydis ATCC 48331]KAJ5026267.1 glycoside hydrolase [Bipolaris maydis]ENH99858.1 glycoside hydrolase family 16 protein [Bipolaris maydis ATCC 48331]KAJ5056808.1 concanavalin A-like lectin/glucanase domain-containing protein [Bipolaris maydis]KAJ6196393.1 concanavalin A-like lectin/glucanase domain-containing protein [Bipolaris maydis]KAJ6270478.1 glycoside hydrolase [Bipolaris maydis]
MRSTTRALAALLSTILYVPSAAQTWSNCNPTLRTDCPPDSALGKTVNIDFSSKSDSFTPQGNPTYGSDGVSFTVSKSGDAPQLTSLWYIMFGRVDIQLKAAPGAGIVSSFVLQSDTLDEIDWEWLGADPDEAQSNYFGKGQTTDYNRGAFHSDPGSQSGFKTYTIIWTPEQIAWQIDGQTVRTLEPANADNQYPQTPMQVKFGSWSGGDPSNPAGTISWARGPTDYSKGPFTMTVKSLKVQDYSTGSQYIYGDQSGTWKSIRSNGGTIFAGGNAPIADAPAVTATANGAPLPFQPHQTSAERPSVYPWIPDPSATPTAQPTFANYPGLPSGWTVSSSGKVIPPSSATMSPPGSSISSPQALPTDSSGNGPKTVTGYDDRGFTTIRTIYPEATPAPSGNGPQGNAGEAIPAAPLAASSWTLVLSSILPWAIVLLHIPTCLGF